MNDWVVESPSFEEQLMNNRIVYLNQKGINEVVELIKNKDKEIEILNKENNILKNNAEHNDKVVDNVNWENMFLKGRNEKAIDYIEQQRDTKTHRLDTRLERVSKILQGVDKE